MLMMPFSPLRRLRHAIRFDAASDAFSPISPPLAATPPLDYAMRAAAPISPMLLSLLIAAADAPQLPRCLLMPMPLASLAPPCAHYFAYAAPLIRLFSPPCHFDAAADVDDAAARFRHTLPLYAIRCCCHADVDFRASAPLMPCHAATHY